jgi:N-acetylmuramoyl-L-alanine amidase
VTLIERKLPRLLLTLAVALLALGPVMGTHDAWAVVAKASPSAKVAPQPVQPTAAPTAPPVIVTQLHWDGESLVVGTDRPLRYRSFPLREPDRIVIDLFDAELGDPTMSRVLSIEREPIRQIRLGAHPDEGFLRVVIDGDRPLPMQISQARGGAQLVIRLQGLPPAEKPADESPVRRDADEEVREKPTPEKRSPQGPAPTKRSPVKIAAEPPRAAEVFGPPERLGPQAAPATSQAEKARERKVAAARPEPKRTEPKAPEPKRTDPKRADAKRSTPQPSRPAVPGPDREAVGVRIMQAGGSTLLKLQGTRTLHLKVHQAVEPARVIVQVPSGALKGTLPAAKGQVEALEIRQDGENWLLEARLPEGPVDVQNRMEDGGKTLVVAIRRQALSSARRPLVLIDPGHGGDDPGALGAGGTRESDVNLAIALKLRDALRGRGVNAVLTRTGDVNMDLESRARLIDQLGAQALVSVHANSHEAAHASGLETYYRTSLSQPFAQQIHQVLVTELQRPDRGIREARLFMLRHPTIPSALIEAGFISNPDEERLLGDGEYQRKAAEAIAKGIAGYLSTPVAEWSE